VRVSEPPPGPLGWAWYPGRRLGVATWPSGVELLQNCYMLFFGYFSSAQNRPVWVPVGRLVHSLGCRVGEQYCAEGLYLLFCHQARSRASSPWPGKGLFLQICYMYSSTLYGGYEL